MMSISQVKTSQFSLHPNTKDDSTWLIFDLESDGLYDEATKIYCIVCYDIKTNQTFSYGPDNIHDGLRHLQSANFLIGHNILFYDCPLIQKLHDDRGRHRSVAGVGLQGPLPVDIGGRAVPGGGDIRHSQAATGKVSASASGQADQIGAFRRRDGQPSRV